MDRGAWQVTVHGGAKGLDMTEHSAELIYNICWFFSDLLHSV